jgi:hypothetical protein
MNYFLIFFIFFRNHLPHNKDIFNTFYIKILFLILKNQNYYKKGCFIYSLLKK